MQCQFDVVIERDEEGLYIASAPQLPGCNTLCLEVEGAPARTLEFVGIRRITGLTRSGHESLTGGRFAIAERWR